MIYFSSDLHFNHNKDFLYSPRNFDSVESMNMTIVNNWNSIVKDEDEVYILGDLMLGNNDAGISFLRLLKGKLHIIIGNHDTEPRIELYKTLGNVVEVCYATQLKYKKAYFFLCHYPTCVGNFDDNKKVWCLCGHSHTQDKFIDMDKKCYHVELDAHNNFPVSIEQVIEDIKNKKDEINKEEYKKCSN